MNYAGIDVGGTSVKICILDQEGRILFSDDVETIRDDPAALARRIAEALKATRIPFVTAGVSCAGRVWNATGRVVASNLRWLDVPFRAIMEDALGCPVAIQNDVAGALMGEWTLGACRGVSDVIYVALGTGVGGAFILNGEPFRGHNGTGGEIGHIITHGGGLPCPCGGRGCFEQYASATALSRMAGGLDGREIFRRANRGDPEMNRVLDEYVRELVIGLASLTGVFRPKMIVLGGGVSHAGEPLLRRVRDELLHRCPSMPLQEKPDVVLAQLGNKAGMIGGGMLARSLHLRSLS